MTNRQSFALFAPSATLQCRALALRAVIVIGLGGVATASGGGAIALGVTLLVAALLAVQLFVLHPVRVLTDGSSVVYLRGYRRREQWPRRLTRFTALPDSAGFAAWTAADHVVVRCRHWSAAEIDALLRDLNADPLWTVPDPDAVSSARWRSARGGG